MKIIAIALLMLISGATLASSKLVPVIVGQHGPEIDACPSFAEMSQADVLRKGPGQNFEQVTDLAKGEKFYVCGHSKNGEWTSVVLTQDGLLDCQAASPTQTPHAYTGPCMSGWLPTQHVKIIAG